MTRLLITTALAVALATAAQAADRMPHEFQGEWCTDSDPEPTAYRRGRCSNPDSDGGLKITHDGFEEVESGCNLRRVVSANRGRWVGDFDCAGEGMTWTATYAISIRKGRLLMTTVRRSEDKPEAEPSDTKLPTATARRAVCVGPIEHYRHGSETNMRVWRDGPSGETVYDCEFESDTPSGRLIMRVCGPIVDVADENLKLACRIEGLFEIHGGKVRMNLIRADNVKLVRRGGKR